MAHRSIGIMAVILGAAMLVASARAAIVPWNNPAGGDFQTGANWAGGVVPGASDVALFDLSTNGYTVTVGGNPTVFGVRMEDEGLSDLSPMVFDLTGMFTATGDMVIGSGTGNSAFVNVLNGQTFVQNLIVGTSQGQGFLLLDSEFFVSSTVSISANNGGVPGFSEVMVAGSSATLTEGIAALTYIGHGAGSQGALSVLGSGYAEFHGNFQVGDNGGSGVVNVYDGSVLVNLPGSLTTLGSSGGIGYATVDGVASHWDVQGLLAIGTFADAHGELTINSGGLVTVDFLNIGSSGVGNGSVGEVFVDGLGSSIQCLNTTVVTGATSTSVLLMTNDADAVTDELQIGSTPGGQPGSVATRDPGSTLTVNGNAHVGWLGTGHLAALIQSAISVGGVVNVGNNGTGFLFLNGESQLDCGDLRVGWDADGQGVLTILGGSTVSAGYTIVGGSAGTFGVIHLEEPGSTLQIDFASPLRIGEYGSGRLEIFDGGEVIADNALIGIQPGSTGDVLIAGVGSWWEVNGPLDIGSPSASATLTMRDGGALQVAGGIDIHGPNSGSTFALMSGYGNVQGSVTNSGAVSPGYGVLDPDTFSITGNYTQTADGSLIVQLSDGIPALDVGGAASLNGELRITGPDAFIVPTPGVQLPLLTANSVTGAFATVVQPAGNDGLVYEVVPGKGQSLDILASADCNHNGQADVKDIDQQISEDVDENGIPDECVDPGNGCGNNRWFCAANWPLGDIPGEFSADFHVTMGTGDNLCLDEDATIQSLILRNGSFLDMSDPNGGTCDGDLVLDGVEGMTIDNSTLSIGPGRTVDSGLGGTTNLWLRRGGSIEADGSTIDVGDVLIESGGSYRSATTVTSPPNNALLRTGNITLRGGFSTTASELNLTGDMEVIADGDVVIDGTGAPCDCGAAARARRADVTPPVFRNDGRRFIAVDNIGLKGSINITIQSALVLGGHFENESVCPGCADLSGGTVQLNGPGLFNGEPRGGVFPQRFEVASPDMGPGVEIPDQPWALDTFEIGPGVEATFDDRFDNDGAGQVPCSEALYVRHLIIGAGASAVARHVRLYYDTLTIDPTGTLTEIGCGVASEIACIVAAPAGPEPSPQPKNRYLSFVPGNPGSPTAIRVTLTNLNGFPSFNGQVRWVGPPVLRPLGNGGQFWAAPLQCTPHFMEWDNVGVVHVYGAEVVPSSTYDVQIVHANCDGALGVGASYSSSLSVLTGKWGDVQTPYGAGQPNFADISAIVATFAGNASSIGKARAQLQPNVPNPAVSINFSDISACVSAFRGIPYSFAGPSACP